MRLSPLTKHKLKRLLARIGVLGSAPKYTMRDSLQRIKSAGFEPKTIIDIGVADGTFDLYETFPGSRLLLVEPMVEFEPQLRSICDVTGGVYDLVAAAGEDGEAEIAFGNYLHGASLAAGGDIRRKIPTARVDSLVEKHGLSGPVLLKADVQGGELEVLAGAGKTLDITEVVILEVLFFDTVGNGVTIDRVIAEMKDRGFVPHDFFDALLRPLDRAVGAADIAFAKKDGVLRQRLEWASPEQDEKVNRLHRLRRLLNV